MAEERLPQYNTRVILSSSNKDGGVGSGGGGLYEEGESGEDEECPNREQIKKRSEDLVNSKVTQRDTTRHDTTRDTTLHTHHYQLDQSI